VTPDARRPALDAARLYLICDAGQLARAPLGAVDILQLRDKHAPAEELRAAAELARRRCDEHQVLFVVNDDPELARDVAADGVHLGQDDMPVSAARAIVGPELLIGLSTHTPDQVDAARGADYLGVGPVHATPTKPGRPAVGLDLVRHAAAHATRPFFAIGGIDAANVAAVRAAGAERIAVVRAVAAAPDPAAAATALRRAAFPAERPTPAGESAAAPQGPEAAPKESPSERRAAAVRAELEPLAPGELPPPLLVAIVLAALLGLVNLAGYLAGTEVGGHRLGPGILSFSVVMGVAAGGMWARRYWAVLAFQAFVALIVLYFCLLLILASNLEALILSLAVIGLGGWLFWKLVRVMARIQTPTSTSP
jgi:thiamine-phosphate pyrophosphorylase